MKINLGSFILMFHGWLNIDVLPLGVFAHQNNYSFLAHDLRAGIPFPDESVDLIFSSHFLEHITYDEGHALLRECKRVLRPGGVMRLIVPDTKILMELYLSGGTEVLDKINEPCARLPMPVQKIWHVMSDNHRAAYDFELIKQKASILGFSGIEQRKFQEGNQTIVSETKDMYPEISVFVELAK